MGKRKSAKQAPKRNKYVLPTEFDCKFCDHKQCVDVKLQRSKHVGSAKCRVCKKSFETGINHLHERADVYCAWMDAIDEQNKQENLEENREGQKEDVEQQSEYQEDDKSSFDEEEIRNKKIMKKKDRPENQKKRRKIQSSSEEEDDDSLEDMVND